MTPLIDHVLTFPSIDPKRLGLLGNSYGGYLAPRAAAFEPRLGALICIDGVFDAYQGFTNNLSDALRQRLESDDRDGFDTAIAEAITFDTNLRWMVQQGLWAFRKITAFDFFHHLKSQTLDGLAHRIECPTFVGEAQHDRFFDGQPKRLADAIGDHALLHRFTDETSAGLHCQVGAAVEMNRALLDWVLHILS